MHPMVLLRARGGFVVDRQNPVSLATFGDHTGSRWRDIRVMPADARLAALVGLEEAMDTGKLQRSVLETELGPGVTTTLALRTGQVLMTWAPVIEQPSLATGTEALCRLAAEHLDRLAWALEEGRPLPHLPAALRQGRAAGASTPPRSR